MGRQMLSSIHGLGLIAFEEELIPGPLETKAPKPRYLETGF
jgi:hypothetical protein